MSGSMRFTFCMVIFLKTATAATIQREPESASRCLGRSVTIGRRDIRSICERNVEPLGVEPIATLDAVLNALAQTLK
eukprot:scaffold656084_cov39-Prasinocladus_malaysianus.AAC.1